MAQRDMTRFGQWMPKKGVAVSAIQSMKTMPVNMPDSKVTFGVVILWCR